MQIDKIFSTQFVDPTTRAPITDLTGVTITILEIASDGTTASVPVSNASCINGTLGFYRYYFTGMENKIYEFYFNPNDARVQITAGFVDKRLNNLDGAISEIRAGGGGGFSSQAIQTSIGNLGRKMDKKIEDEHTMTRELIAREHNETNSHIDLAKSETIRTIDGIEQAETDTSDIIAGIGVIKAQNTKLAKYLKGEDDKEKAEMEKNHKKMMDDMESAYSEMEKENGKIIEEKESEKTSIMKDADEIIQAIEDEKIEISEKNKSEMINKIKTLI